MRRFVAEGVEESLGDSLAGVQGRSQESLARDEVSLGHWVPAVVLDIDRLTHHHTQL